MKTLRPSLLQERNLATWLVKSDNEFAEEIMGVRSQQGSCGDGIPNRIIGNLQVLEPAVALPTDNDVAEETMGICSLPA